MDPERSIVFRQSQVPEHAELALLLGMITPKSWLERVPTAAITHPIPASYATLTYNSLHAFGFVNAQDEVKYGRYSLVPERGEESLSDEEGAARSTDFLRDELAERLAQGPAVFHLRAQLADGNDPVDDPTEQWPVDRDVVDLARLEVTGLASDREHGGDVLVFDPHARDRRDPPPR